MVSGIDVVGVRGAVIRVSEQPVVMGYRSFVVIVVSVVSIMMVLVIRTVVMMFVMLCLGVIPSITREW